MISVLKSEFSFVSSITKISVKHFSTTNRRSIILFRRLFIFKKPIKGLFGFFVLRIKISLNSFEPSSCVDSIEDAEREHSPSASEAFEIEEKERSLLDLQLKLGLTVKESSVFTLFYCGTFPSNQK